MRKLIRNASRKLSLLGITKEFKVPPAGRFASYLISSINEMMKMDEACRYIDACAPIAEQTVRAYTVADTIFEW